jgi:hypothetical protein
VTLVFRARKSTPVTEREPTEGWVSKLVKFLRAS